MNPTEKLPDFLPGRFVLERGSAADYHRLAAFHYAAGPPATWADIRAIRYVQPQQPARLAAVGVLSWPVPSCRIRERWFGLDPLARDQNLRFANRCLRTISRIIVHPQFRAIGLSPLLVRCLCAHCPTRWVEAIAVMGHIHPLFTRAGMLHGNPHALHEPAYFILDREPHHEHLPARCAA